MSNGSPGLDPVKATVDAFQTVRNLLNTLKTLDQKLPQVIEALSLIAQLQQDIAEVNARNSQLERELIQAERHQLELSKHVQSEEAWRAQLDKLEKCQTSHGKWVFREKGTDEPLVCPNCTNDRRITFVQHTVTHHDGRTHHSYYCPTCKAYF